jgi:hypothetical protein
MGSHPPHTFWLGLASSPTHPLMSTPSFIWLLFILIKRRPPKAKSPPLPLLFDASYFASPSKQTNDIECNPDSSRPAHGVGEQRRRDLVAPLLYPWRERGQSRWRVGWHGSSCWLLCLCVLCFVFCAPTDDQTTVPYFSPVIIFSSFVIIGVRILTRQTVIWDLFQPSARWLYLFFFGRNFFRLQFEPAKKHGQPDDCTFLFSGSNFFQSYVSTIIGARVKIRTPITTRKITTRKKKVEINLR